MTDTILENDDLSIAQMARRSGLSPHTLRYYERIGLIAPTRRAANGHRRYRAADIAWVEFLTRLRDTGMPIRQMKRYADLRAQGDETAAARRTLLQAHRRHIADRIERLSINLDRLDDKIETYRALERRLSPKDDRNDR